MLHLGAISYSTNGDSMTLFCGRQETQLKHKRRGPTSSVMTTSAQRPTIDTGTTIRLVKKLALGLSGQSIQPVTYRELTEAPFARKSNQYLSLMITGML